MSEHQPQEQHGIPRAPGAAEVAQARLSTSRRSLLRSGLAGAPALLALKATPVMACNCKKPSGFSVSGNLSRGVKNCADPCAKPTVWKGKCGTSSPYYYTGTTISKTANFNTLSTNGKTFQVNSTYTNTTLNSCLSRGDQDLQALIVAVYLEAVVTGGTNFPSREMVIDMWNQAVISSVGYLPTTNSTTRWYKNEVTNYLKYLTNQVA